MKSYNVDDFPIVFLTADVVVIKDNEVLLIQRLREPFKNMWALPGGFFDVTSDADLAGAASRELAEETSLVCSPNELKLIGIFSKKNRDPREAISTKPCRIVSAAYKFQLNREVFLKAKDDALSLKWFKINSLPELAFDHLEIIQKALS